MTKLITTARLVRVLKKAPEKRFRIIELSHELTDDEGKIDIGKCMDRQGEMDAAVTEVQFYVKSTKNVTDSLLNLLRRGEAATPDGLEDVEWDYDEGPGDTEEDGE